jgi:AcrR family transcriptional regulator
MNIDPSAAPVRERGLHSRAGNAMARTRSAVLDGTVRAVEKHGARRTTMADIAMLAGVAKGTLYNHFRTKEAVYAAAVDAAVRSLGAECAVVAGEDLVEALVLAADRIGTDPALRRVAAEEPAVLAALVTVADDGAWVAVRAAVADVLAAAGVGSDTARLELVVRWLVSFVATPGPHLQEQAAVLAAALRASEPVPAGSADTSS